MEVFTIHSRLYYIIHHELADPPFSNVLAEIKSPLLPVGSGLQRMEDLDISRYLASHGQTNSRSVCY
jgi:hypothetical protein